MFHNGFLQQNNDQIWANIQETYLGRPTAVLVGPEKMNKISLGEHMIVTLIWPPSFRAVLGEGTLSMIDDHKLYRIVGIQDRDQ